MDKRNKRRAASRNKVEAAIQRLQSGSAHHPLHIGIKVRITKQAVAREAGVSSATLYRFPDLVQSIDYLFKNKQVQLMPQSEQRRRTLLARIHELERQNNQLLAENLRLQRELAAAMTTSIQRREQSLAERQA